MTDSSMIYWSRRQFMEVLLFPGCMEKFMSSLFKLHANRESLTSDLSALKLMLAAFMGNIKEC